LRVGWATSRQAGNVFKDAHRSAPLRPLQSDLPRKGHVKHSWCWETDIQHKKRKSRSLGMEMSYLE
jgi:hypothetical protein